MTHQDALGAQIMQEVKRYDDGMGCTRRQLVDNILVLISQTARALVAAPPPDKRERKLTLPELNHISALLETERESGSYAGPREQYYARTERLIKWCEDQIGEK